MAQYFADDYSGMTAGNLSLTAGLIASGYSELENSGTPANVVVLARASLPSGLLNHPRFSNSSGKQVLKFTLPATDVESRLLWSGFPAGVQTVSVSWWEYRTAGNLGGEKFCRVGNFVSGPGSNRGIDSIITLGQVSGTTLIANSANMHDYGDHSMAPGISGWPGLNHFEAVYALSTGTTQTGLYRSMRTEPLSARQPDLRSSTHPHPPELNSGISVVGAQQEAALKARLPTRLFAISVKSVLPRLTRAFGPCREDH